MATSETSSCAAACAARGLEPQDRARSMIAVLRHRRDAREDVDDPVATMRALELAGFSAGDLRNTFGSLGHLEQAAGLIAIPADEFRQPDTLLADLHRVARALRRIPSCTDYERLGRFSPRAFRRRFGRGDWAVTLAAFGRYLVRNHGTHLFSPADLARLGIGATPDSAATQPAAGTAAAGDARATAAAPIVADENRTDASTPTRSAPRMAPLFGAPLAHEAFINEPVNEQSTVGLFCCLAPTLGIFIRHLDDRRFPDAYGLRRVPGRDARFQEVRIEVQFRSRDFVRDGHDPAAVDILVCFEDNWPDRPAHLELIELRRVLQELRAAGAAA